MSSFVIDVIQTKDDCIDFVRKNIDSPIVCQIILIFDPKYDVSISRWILFYCKFSDKKACHIRIRIYADSASFPFLVIAESLKKLCSENLSLPSVKSIRLVQRRVLCIHGRSCLSEHVHLEMFRKFRRRALERYSLDWSVRQVKKLVSFFLYDRFYIWNLYRLSGFTYQFVMELGRISFSTLWFSWIWYVEPFCLQLLLSLRSWRRHYNMFFPGHISL